MGKSDGRKETTEHISKFIMKEQLINLNCDRIDHVPLSSRHSTKITPSVVRRIVDRSLKTPYNGMGPVSIG